MDGETLSTLTPITADEARDALITAWGKHFGQSPNANVLALLMAQSALETGNWQLMRNYNFGNLKSLGSGDFFVHDGAMYQSYELPQDGADAYVSLLLRSDRPNWRAGLLTGDPKKFNDGLQSPRYYTANPAVYGDTLRKLFRQHGGIEESQSNMALWALTGALGLGLFMTLRK